MSQEAYEAHMERLTASYVRTGSLDRSVGTLDPYTATTLGNLEVAIRYYDPEKHLSDIKTGFNASFLTWFTGKCFLEYLEYKKLNEELSLDEWMASVSRQFFDAGYDLESLAAGRKGGLAEVVGRDGGGGLGRTRVTGGAGEGGGRVAPPVQDESDLYDASILQAVLADSSSGEADGEGGAGEWGDLYSLPTGTLPDGFDNWAMEVFDFNDIYPDTVVDEANPYPVSPDPQELTLLTIPDGEDEAGFDFWGTAPEGEEEGEESGEVVSGPTFGPLFTQPLDIDEHGFDLWEADDDDDLLDLTGPALRLLSEPTGVDPEGFDLWGTSQDLYSNPLGTDDNGFDIWFDATESIIPPEGVDDLGFDIWSKPPSVSSDGDDSSVVSYGVDANGFDIWKMPASAQKDIIRPSLEVSSGTVPSGRPVARQTPKRSYSFMPAQKTKEDLFVESILDTSKKVQKLTKKVFGLWKG